MAKGAGWGIRPPMRGGRWIVRRDEDSRWLCQDGLWRACVAGVEDFKTYRSIGWVERAMRLVHGMHSGWTAIAVYAGDVVDRDGNVTRGDRF